MSLGRELRELVDHDVAALHLREEGEPVDHVWWITREEAGRESVAPPTSFPESVEIGDNGPGVADVQRIFQAGYTTKSFGGGMGLAISRQIARVHEGRLVARRPTGGGTETVLTLKKAASDVA